MTQRFEITSIKYRAGEVTLRTLNGATVHSALTSGVQVVLAPPPEVKTSDGLFACAGWCVTYSPFLPGEKHHRNCKHWHRVLGEAIVTQAEFMVLGDPAPDDESHNCDVLGCGTFSHVLVRMPLRAIDSAAVLDVLAERQRQITAEGWTPEHDDEHDEGELACAASAYALAAGDRLHPYSQGDGGYDASNPPPAWPNDWAFKPGRPRVMLVKAAALILAEIERLDRAAQPLQGGGR